MTARLIDAEDRRLAVTDFGSNRVVIAGAGTGKTSLLVERILNGCLGEGIDLDAMAAITFTEKAAAEMRDRLSTALDEIGAAAAGRTPVDWDAKRESYRSWEYLRGARKMDPRDIALRSRRALEMLDEAVVGTIHSLCADLLRRYPREAGIDPMFAVDDGMAHGRIAEQVWEEWFGAEMQADALRVETWGEILARVPIGQIREAALAMAAMPVSADGRDYERREATTVESLQQQARALVVQIETARNAASDVRPNMVRHLEVCRDFLSRFSERGPGETAAEGDFPTAAVPSPGKTVTGVDPDELIRIGTDGRNLVTWCAGIDPLADRIAGLLLPFVDTCRNHFAEAGYLSFDDLLVRTRDLLRDRKEVRRREKIRLRSLLVDEFQDTNPLQYEIVFFLGEAEEESGDDPFATELAPGKLFIVGDPKQSIYRFRGADIEAYRRAVDRIVVAGGATGKLGANFRSPPDIVEPLNRMFEAAFDSHSSVQAPYDPIASAREAAEEPPRVVIWSIPLADPKDKASRIRRREGVAIADGISRQVRSGRRRWRDFALLFRAMTDVDLYLRSLREARIPFVVEGGRLFGRKQEVREFLSLLRVLVNPNDAVALLAVLRSPLGGVTDVELACHAARGGAWRLDAAADRGQCPDIDRTLRELRDLRRAVQSLPSDRAVRMVLEERFLPELNAAAYEGSQRVANLFKIVDRLAIRSREERLSLEETVRALQREFDREEAEDPESPLADEALDAVRILTVHRAKGLQFPVVILPDLGRGPNPGGRIPAADWVGIGGGERGLALQAGRGSSRFWNATAALHRWREPEHERAERVRTFYVACTRAEEELIFVNGSPKSTPWLECLGAWGYRWEDGLPPETNRFSNDQVGHQRAAATGRRAPEDKTVFSQDQIAAAVHRFQRAKGQAESQRDRWIRTPTGIREMTERQEEEGEGSRPRGGEPGSSRLPAAAGIGVHWLLQVWDRNDPEWFRDNAAAAAAAGALDTGVEPDAVRQAIEAILDPFLASELPRRLREIDLVGREIPFEAADGDALLRGWIDLVYRRDGAWVVADFKTDRVDAGAEAALLDRYAPQLSAYARALRRALDLDGDPAREIWSIRTGRILVYPATG